MAGILSLIPAGKEIITYRKKLPWSPYHFQLVVCKCVMILKDGGDRDRVSDQKKQLRFTNGTLQRV